MSTTNIKLKRSSVPGKQPNTSILELGEVALNTYDGKIFIKKDDGAESIVTIQEVTEDNLAIDSSLLDNSTASTLAGVLDDLDAAITTSAGGGLSQVTTDSTLTGLGTAGSPLSVVNDGHSHTVSNITNFTSSVNSAIDTRVDKTFVDSLDVDADTLDGANGSFYLDYDNFVNTPSIPVSGVDFDPVGTDNSTDVTLAGSYDYLTITGQQITLNQIDATTDVSGLATVATSGSYNDLTDKPTDSDTTYDLVSPGSGVIRLSDSANSNDDITFVGSGATTVSSNATHVTISSTDNNTTYSAGDGIDLTGTTFSHADTSTQASLSVLSGGAVVSDIDLDGFGHVTSLSTRTLTTNDIGEGTNLYYTTARANTDIDARVTKSFVDALDVDADTLDGANGSFYLDYSNFTNTPSIPQSGVDFDPVGTDNSTDVTLAGSYDYLTITDQQITLNQIDYTTDISNTPTIGDGNITFSGDSIIGVSGSFSLNDTANSQITLSVNAAAISITESQISDFDTYLPTADFTATANTWLATRSTSNLSEGTNLYYTTARANTDIDARVTKSFVDALNVDAETLDGQDGSYYLDYNNFTNTPTDSNTTYDLTIPATGTIRLSDSANSNDDVVFVGSGATTVSSNTTHIIISSTDNNTTYTAGNGIDLSGTTFSVAAGSGLTQDSTGLSHSDTSTQTSLTALTGANVVSDIDLDGFGHVTSLATRAMTLADLGYTGETDATADQTITAGTGLTGGGTGDVTINHSNSITAGTVSEGGVTRTLAYGGSFNVPSVTYDAQGHITGTATVALTLPASDNTDTTYSAGDGLTLTSTTFSVNTAGDSSLVANSSGLFIDDSTLSIATSQLTGDVALGTQTSGNYVATTTGGAGVTITGGTGEGSTPTIEIGQDVSSTANVTFQNGTFTGDLQIDGDFTVSGNVVTINVQELSVEDNLIYLNANSAQTNPDLGWAGSYNDGTYAHAGVFRDASDGVFKVFDSYTPEPDASAFIDTSHTSFNLADIQAATFIGTLNGTANNATNLNGQAASFYLNYNNFTNTPTIGDATVTISAGSGLTTGGTFTTNQVANSTVTIAHADTSSQASLTALTGGNVVSDIDLDGFGHVTNLATRTLTTSDIGEDTNLYYTVARANTAIDDRVTQSFVNALNVTAAGVQADSVALGTDTTGNYVATISGTTNEIEVTGSGSETATVTIGLPNDVDIAGSITIASLYDLIGETASTTTTTQTEIASFASATYSSGKFVIQATDSVSGEVHVTELLIVHDGTTASATEYGTIHTGSSPLATYDVDIDTGNVRVLATAASTNSTTYKVTENLITA